CCSTTKPARRHCAGTPGSTPPSHGTPAWASSWSRRRGGPTRTGAGGWVIRRNGWPTSTGGRSPSSSTSACGRPGHRPIPGVLHG
ncbi:MAG: hypothetical protein AVDCRST_MAG10-3527, partial [uncultured Acidimicrobiales bacterium]